MNGIIYCRVSSLEQVQGTSLENQKLACLEYAKAKGINVLEVFVEKGESATAANRTELLKALDYCRKNKAGIQAFLVWKLDRFARNTTDHFSLQAQLRKYGTSLYSVTEPIGTDPMGKMMEAMLAGYAQFENDIRKQRCEAGLKRKLAEGIWPWRPPIGYIHSKTRVDRRKTAPDEPDPQRFPIIQRALRAYATGRYTILTLVHLMNSWGLTTRTSRPMFKQLAERILKDKFYAGALVDPWTGEEYPGRHAPMITIGEYKRIQYFKRRHSRADGIPRVRLNPDFPLRSFVRCTCGRPLTASWHTGRTKKYAYYECHSAACTRSNRTIAKRRLETLFRRLLQRLAPKELFLQMLTEVLIDHWKTTSSHRLQNADRVRRERRRLEERRRELLRMRLDREITADDFSRARADIDSQLTILTHSGELPALMTFDPAAVMPRVASFLRNIAREWTSSQDIGHKQRIQTIVFPDGIVYDQSSGDYGTAVLSDLFSLSRDFRGDKSQIVAEVGLRLHQILVSLSGLATLVEDHIDDDPLISSQHKSKEAA